MGASLALQMIGTSGWSGYKRMKIVVFGLCVNAGCANAIIGKRREGRAII